MNKTDNIYNDFESYKYKNIFNNIQIAICNTKQEIEWNKKEGNKTECELIIKLESERESRIYKYDNINSLLNSAYFIWQLEKHREDIQLLQIWINNEITYIFDYWRSELERELQQQIEDQQKEIEIYKQFIKKYNAEKTFEDFKKTITE